MIYDLGEPVALCRHYNLDRADWNYFYDTHFENLWLGMDVVTRATQGYMEELHAT